MISELKGISYAIICVLLYSLFNIYFKAVSLYEINSLLFLSESLVFASLTLLILGGKTKLIFKAIKDPLTWLYSITFVLECFFALELLNYILATEMVLVSRLSVIFSFILGLLLLKRTNLKKSFWGIPLIILGIVIVFCNIEENLKQVTYLALGLSITKSLYYISIELNKVGYKTKNYLNDFSVLGYILGITSIILISILMFLSNIISTDYIPKFKDFTNVNTFIFAAFYGVFGVTVLRYLEFKSVQSVKSEIFMCILTVVPLVTLVFESMAGYLKLISSNVIFSPPMLFANLLIITGGLLIVILKFINADITDEKDKQSILKIIRATDIFTEGDNIKSANLLGINKKHYLDLLKNKKFKVSKIEYKKIQENFNKNIAMSDHLTGLCNKLEFMSLIKHINKEEIVNLFFIDLNKFKPVNDTYGHDAGDYILKQVGFRLTKLIEDGIVTRMGGDEYCILLKNILKEDAVIMINTIIKEIEKPFIYKEKEIKIGASVGLSNYPEDVKEPESLIKYADEQMYKLKEISER